MELIKSNKQELKIFEPVKLEYSSLTLTEQTIYQNSLQPKLASFNSVSKLVLVNEIVLMAGKMLGTKLNPDDAENLQAGLEENLDRFNQLSKEEILYFTKKGLSGDYLGNESFVFFSPSNWIQWGKKYMDEEKIQVIKKIANSARNEPLKPIPTDEELKAESIRIANSYIQKVIDKKNVDEIYQFAGGLNHLFDIAFKFRLITIIPKERRRLILDQCNNDEDLAKSEIYKLWINEMADAGYKLDENGEIL